MKPSEMTGLPVHKADPGGNGPDGATPCGCCGGYFCRTCKALIKRVPGGQGPTWVHAATGMVAAPGPTAPGTREEYMAGLVAAVLAREDAAEALGYVLAQDVGGPSCGCGGYHWECDADLLDDEDEPESVTPVEDWFTERQTTRRVSDDPGTCDYPNCHDLMAGMVGRYKACAVHLAGIGEMRDAEAAGNVPA